MKAAKTIILSVMVLTSTYSFGTCSPSVSESKAGGNIVITNNCELSDEEVLKKLEKFKSEQTKNNSNQNKNQRELIRNFNKYQHENSAKLDLILEKFDQRNKQEAEAKKEDNKTSQNTLDTIIIETSNTTMETNYRTILESIKSHPLIIQEDVIARLISNQNIVLDCTKIAEIAIEARKLNELHSLSISFIKKLAPQVPQPLKPSCFQELTKGMSAESADGVITAIKSTTKAAPEDTSIAKTSNTQNTKPSILATPLRPIVRSLTIALGNESGGYRVEAIKTAIESLPKNLTAEEIASIIGSEKGGYKESSLRILLPRIQPNSLDGSKIVKILNPDQGSYRYNHIVLLVPHIKPFIEAPHVTEILDGLYNSQRGEVISLLAEKIKTPLSDDSIISILGNISGDYRKTAIRALIEAQSAGFTRDQENIRPSRNTRSSRPRQPVSL